jgi:hypothetical protein
MDANGRKFTALSPLHRWPTMALRECGDMLVWVLGGECETG